MKRILLLTLALAVLGVITLSLVLRTSALEVKEVPTTTLKVVDSPSQVNTGKTILQPTYNPQLTK